MSPHPRCLWRGSDRWPGCPKRIVEPMERMVHPGLQLLPLKPESIPTFMTWWILLCFDQSRRCWVATYEGSLQRLRPETRTNFRVARSLQTKKQTKMWGDDIIWSVILYRAWCFLTQWLGRGVQTDRAGSKALKDLVSHTRTERLCRFCWFLSPCDPVISANFQLFSRFCHGSSGGQMEGSADQKGTVRTSDLGHLRNFDKKSYKK